MPPTPSSSHKQPQPARKPSGPSAVANVKQAENARSDPRTRTAAPRPGVAIIPAAGQAQALATPPKLHDLPEWLHDLPDWLHEIARTMPPMMSRQQVADALGIGREAFMRCVRRGELTVVRLGARVLVPRTELLRWVDSRQVNVSAVRHGRKPIA
jgi:excisionase family DNA binding protein